MLAAGSAPAGAAAEVSSERSNCLDYRGATGCFVANGDYFRLHDGRSDGLRPEIQWETDYGRAGLCQWRGTSYWTTCNHNFRESSTVNFRLVLRRVSTGDVVDGTSWVDCSRRRLIRAGSIRPATSPSVSRPPSVPGAE